MSFVDVGLHGDIVKICFQTAALEELCCWRTMSLIMKFYVCTEHYFRTNYHEFPTVYKPLKPIILRTGIFLGAHVVYVQ